MKQVPEPAPYGWQSLDPTSAHEYVWPAIRNLLPPHNHAHAPKALDLGCGNGFIASQLHAIGYRVTGLDQSPDGLALAKHAYPEIHFEVVSIYDDIRQQLGESDFDLVVSSEVIEHLYFPRKLLENAFQLLKPGGAIIVTTPYHGYLKNLALSLFNKWDDHHTVHWDGGHIKFFSERTLAALLREAGFTDIRYLNAGRAPWLWKSMVCRARRPNS